MDAKPLQYPATDAVAERALSTDGRGDPGIYPAVARLVQSLAIEGGFVVDVGCGRGNLWRELRTRFTRCVGVDAVRYAGLPAEMEFHEARLDSDRIPLPPDSADLVACVETIEHLENPRALMRELARIAKPGAWIVVTTPNQLSLLSILTLAVKHRFEYFQDAHYPAHLTALLEIDLVRMARESGLRGERIDFTMSGRIPLSRRKYPCALSRAFPRALSDHVILAARKPASGE